MSLNLLGYISEEWNNCTLSLNRVDVLLSNINDDIIWDKKNCNGEVTTKQAIYVIVEEEATGSQ